MSQMRVNSPTLHKTPTKSCSNESTPKFALQATFLTSGKIYYKTLGVNAGEVSFWLNNGYLGSDSREYLGCNGLDTLFLYKEVLKMGKKKTGTRRRTTGGRWHYTQAMLFNELPVMAKRIRGTQTYRVYPVNPNLMWTDEEVVKVVSKVRCDDLTFYKWKNGELKEVV